uniref:Elongation of very long chain fatty acids protein n=1 Tax=Parasteatoda tepidariorum TaxID=114398 RepID=A0A2L2Y3K6_PARTP
MTTLVRSVSDVYDEYMASGDPRVTEWFLMDGPGPTIMLVILYVLFVKKIGPAWMEDRKPFDLRYAMLLYNAVIVLTNFYLILDTFRILLKPNHSLTCRIDKNKYDPDNVRLAELGWWFFFIKFIEFADTIFFVLRKKNSHISTLHVVHHAVVPIAVWGGLRIEPGSYNYFFPLDQHNCAHRHVFILWTCRSGTQGAKIPLVEEIPHNIPNDPVCHGIFLCTQPHDHQVPSIQVYHLFEHIFGRTFPSHVLRLFPEHLYEEKGSKKATSPGRREQSQTCFQ